MANAGIGIGGVTLDQEAEAGWTDTLDINLGGVEDGQSRCAAYFSSVGELKAYPHTGQNTVSKHGVVGLIASFRG